MSNGIPAGQENIGIYFPGFQKVLKICIVNWILHSGLSETPWLGLQIITFPIHNFCLFSIPDFSEKNPPGMDANKFELISYTSRITCPYKYLSCYSNLNAVLLGFPKNCAMNCINILLHVMAPSLYRSLYVACSRQRRIEGCDWRLPCCSNKLTN